MYEPKIIAYACTYCSYPGADLAGTSRIKYSPNVNIIRVLCSGRVSAELILRTFARGRMGFWYWVATLAIAISSMATIVRRNVSLS